MYVCMYVSIYLSIYLYHIDIDLADVGGEHSSFFRVTYYDIAPHELLVVAVAAANDAGKRAQVCRHLASHTSDLHFLHLRP